MGLIFHGKKGNGSYLFGLSNKLTFWEINTSNGNGKGQDSNGKGQMSHPLSFTVTIVCYGNGTGQ